MTFLGHTAASYLLARPSQLFGYPISAPEIEICIVAGNILDLDVLAGLFLGKTGDKHHMLITHTPAAVLFIVVVLALIAKISPILIILISLALLLHLVLDDISYWFYKAKTPGKQPSPANKLVIPI